MSFGPYDPSGEGGPRDGPHGHVHAIGEGHPIELPAWSMRVKVGAAETGGRLTVLEGLLGPRHAGPPAHIHAGHDETFVIIEGQMRFRLADGFHTAVPGETVFASRGLAHGFANPSDEPARYVGILSPSGYEGYFEKVAAYVADNGAMPGIEVVRGLMAEHDTVLAPPLADPEDDSAR